VYAGKKHKMRFTTLIATKNPIVGELKQGRLILEIIKYLR